MRIMVLGDVHGMFARLNELINSKQPDIIIQCGDFGYYPEEVRLDSVTQGFVRPFDPATAIKNTLQNGKRTKIYWCDGNHEHYPSLFSRWKEAGGRVEPFEVGPEIYYMPRGSTLDLPSGEKVCFLGGARSVDRPLRDPDDWWDEEILTPDVLDVLPESADMVISHTAPWSFGMDEAMGPYCWPEWDMTADTSCDVLEEALKRLKPLRWYFAHFHFYKTGEIASGRKWTALSDLEYSGRGRAWEWLTG
ncbi:metallophosphoesterase family protein [Desulfonatronum thiodismutans]|uniref:metallophosphoesterase family protein n=1 Tax=Desulfonatronum thiodismutans TaxID=159290 RepID=UPI0004ABE7A1|nr:metallophosphoesterase [Desulfonatronum thiodismutans]